MGGEEAAVEIAGLVRRYGRTVAVDGLDLTVRRGSITAVLGPNGAGKTTTIETCEGFRTPDAGRVRVLGLDPVRDAAALRPRIGVMLQSGGIYPSVRAMEMLHYTASLYADPLHPGALGARLGLDACGRTSYRRLSGGQQQRLALALAVVGRPELVFLDEPTAGLDPQARHVTWELVRELRADGVTVVLSTHLMEEAEELADRVAIIDGGRVIAEGPPDRLRGDGTDSLRFEGRSGLEVASLRAALPDGSEVSEPSPGHYRVTGDVGPQLLATVTAWCAQHEVLPDRITTRRHSLEDVFLELTGKELRR